MKNWLNKTWAHLVTPNGVHDKEQLNENTSKREYTTHNYSWKWFRVKYLFWDCSWNCVCAYWMFNSSFLVTVKCSQEC